MFSIEFNLPTKIVFERGSLSKVHEHVENLGAKAMIITTRGGSMIKYGYYSTLRVSLEKAGIKYCIFTDISSNPRSDEVDRAIAFAEKNSCDIFIGLGGGSAIDSAKAVAATLASGGKLTDYLRGRKEFSEAYPIVAIPTTHGTGSEVNKYAVITDVERKAKVSVVSKRIYPKVAILDPETTLTLPPTLSAATAFDTLAHALESYVSRRTNRLARMFAAEALRNIVENVEIVVKRGINIQARTRLLWASMMAGLAIDQSRTALCHAMEHPVSAHYGNVHHGMGLAALLPAWLKFTLDATVEDFAEIAEILGLKISTMPQKYIAMSVYDYILKLRNNIGLNIRLSDFGVTEKDIDRFVDDVFDYMKPLVYNNPKVPTKEELKRLYLESL